MYVPKFYSNTNFDEISHYVIQNNFGIVVHNSAQLQATHIPFVVKREGNSLLLQSHISVANDLKETLVQNNEVLIIFQGPHTYISSSWYDHENVPTWNYIAVHIYGKARILSSDETLMHLEELVHQHEQHEAEPLNFANFSEDLMKSHIPGLIAFEIRSTEIKSAFKLSQNRDAKNKTAIIEKLIARGDEHSLAVAKAMQSK